MSGTITHSWNGTVLTITSDSGTSSADLKGDIGIRGPQGKPGILTNTYPNWSNLKWYVMGDSLTDKNKIGIWLQDAD